MRKLYVILIFLCSSLQALAQTSDSTLLKKNWQSYDSLMKEIKSRYFIRAFLVNEKGERVEGAMIQLINKKMKIDEAQTDKYGYFQFIVKKPSKINHYTIMGSHQLYKPFILNAIKYAGHLNYLIRLEPKVWICRDSIIYNYKVPLINKMNNSAVISGSDIEHMAR
ncbi:MAG: hypothetical protein JST82_14570 [Bacteroidetes bacterium]|nr:hypothetical protein [Bacteroidota bacterium]